MNCKPGDLAVIVLPGEDSINLGKLVHVIAPIADFIYGAGWWLVVSLSPAHMVGGTLSQTGCIEDFRLRPIRDPGDDAVDEMVLRKPVSTPETA